MSHTKILIDGTWINKGTPDQPQWELMVYPVALTCDESNITSTIVLLNDSNWKAPLATLLSCNEPSTDVTLHFFGEYECSQANQWRLYLTTKIPYVKNNKLSAQVRDGYVDLDDIKPKDTEDDLDMWIYQSLMSITGPRTIHFD